MADMLKSHKWKPAGKRFSASPCGRDVPLTYMNSTAAIKAFAVSTAGWFAPRPMPRCLRVAYARASAFSFCRPASGPQHRLCMGIPLDEMASGIVGLQGGQTKQSLAPPASSCEGHCAVHQRFLPSHVDQVRAKYPGIQVIVHPECRWEVCQKADALGSTERLIALVDQARGPDVRRGHGDSSRQPHGRRFATQSKRVITSTIQAAYAHHVSHQPAHLAWALENLVEAVWSTASKSARA